MSDRGNRGDRGNQALNTGLLEAGPLPAQGALHHRIGSVLATLWLFGRPHTLIGTTLAIATIFTLAHGDAMALGNRESKHAATGMWPLASDATSTLLAAWLACIAANVAVVGLNQLSDIAIDRINKPGLPLPAKRISQGDARAIVVATTVIAALIAAFEGPWLLTSIAVALIVGGVYSLPPLRLKRHALPAAIAIATVRGPVLHIGLYAHFATRWGAPGWPTGILVALTVFVTLFALAIAIAKDVGDVVGDKRYAIRTVAATAGQRAASRLALALLAAAYALAAATALYILPQGINLVAAAGHVVLPIIVAAATMRLDLVAPNAIARWYRSLWMLLYVEYALVITWAIVRP